MLLWRCSESRMIVRKFFRTGALNEGLMRVVGEGDGKGVEGGGGWEVEGKGVGGGGGWEGEGGGRWRGKGRGVGGGREGGGRWKGKGVEGEGGWEGEGGGRWKGRGWEGEGGGRWKGRGWEIIERGIPTQGKKCMELSLFHTESDGNSNAEVISISDSTPRDSPDVTPGPSVASTATPTPPPSTSGNPGSSTAPSEDDSLLAVRAKLFYKKESEFVDLGVGNLKVQSSSKGMVHLLMRNDTSLGTVLLNVKVSGDMPVSCSKKSVLVVCPTPNPPLSVGEGPVTYLLRVKTTELAEQLLKAIQDNTKA